MMSAYLEKDLLSSCLLQSEEEKELEETGCHFGNAREEEGLLFISARSWKI